MPLIKQVVQDENCDALLKKRAILNDSSSKHINNLKANCEQFTYSLRSALIFHQWTRHKFAKSCIFR
jgi:hypothetical protein